MRAPELGRLLVEMRALDATTFKHLPEEALHSALHRAVNSRFPVLGERMHAANPALISIAPVVEVDAAVALERTVAVGDVVQTWIGLLEPEVLNSVPAVLEREQEIHGGIRLDQAQFAIERLRFVEAYAGGGVLTTYGEVLERAAAEEEIFLIVQSPGLFRSKDVSLIGEDVGAVLLAQMIPGYYRKWRAFAPQLLRQVTAERLREQLTLLGWGGRTLQTTFRTKRPEAAFIGWAHFGVGGSVPFRKEVSALADYAAYCGTGARTAMGRGLTIRRPAPHG